MNKTATHSDQATRIRFHLVESDDYLDHFAVRHTWTPFEAGCLILGLKPGPEIDNEMRVGVFSDEAVTQEAIDDLSPINTQLAAEILNLAKSIRQQWPDTDPVASAVIRWALGKALVHDSPFVRMVLGTIPESEQQRQINQLRETIGQLKSENDKVSDGRGRHHEEKRLLILGTAIKELALLIGGNNRDIPGLMRGGNVNSSAIARYLDKNRGVIGLPAEGEFGFSQRAIEEILRHAVSATESPSKNTAENTDKN